MNGASPVGQVMKSTLFIVSVALTTLAACGTSNQRTADTTIPSSTTTAVAQPNMSVSQTSGGVGATVQVTVTDCPVPAVNPDLNFADSAYLANMNDQAGFHSFPRQQNGSTATGSFQVTPGIPQGLGKFVAFCGSHSIVATNFVVR